MVYGEITTEQLIASKCYINQTLYQYKLQIDLPPAYSRLASQLEVLSTYAM